MNPQLRRWLSLADVTLLPAFIMWFIWRLQFTARGTWVTFPVWLVASFLLHRDTAKTLGWRGDNIWPAMKQALTVFGLMATGLLIAAFLLGASGHFAPHSISLRQLGNYFAFCVLQQVALNSLLHNRMLSLVPNEWVAAGLTGAIFAACHWPNPVLVPLTFVGGAAMAWMFGRVRNVIPLAIGQALLAHLRGGRFQWLGTTTCASGRDIMSGGGKLKEILRSLPDYQDIESDALLLPLCTQRTNPRVAHCG